MQQNDIINLLGYKLYNGKRDFFSNGVTGVINCLNPHSHVVAVKDLHFREALLSSDYLVADGVGIKIAARIIIGEKVAKIAGSDLHLELLNGLNARIGKCFYLGSSGEVLEKIEARLSQEYPNIKTCMYSPPYRKEFSKEETGAMIHAVNNFGPDVLFVGMTAPKQEKWVHANRHLIDAPVICSIGAVFDFYAGTKRRPGKLWIKLGLEWLPRLLREPKRLWRRTLFSTPVFMWIVFKEKFKMVFGLTKTNQS